MWSAVPFLHILLAYDSNVATRILSEVILRSESKYNILLIIIIRKYCTCWKLSVVGEQRKYFSVSFTSYLLRVYLEQILVGNAALNAAGVWRGPGNEARFIWEFQAVFVLAPSLHRVSTHL